MKSIKSLEEEIKKLSTKLQKKEEKIQQYEEDLVNENVIDRWNIGTYLHEELAQKLACAKISTSIIKADLSKDNLLDACEMIIHTLDESIQEVQDLSHDVIPMDIEKDGMEQAFNHLKLQTVNQHGINCRLETDQIIDKVNNRKVASNLFSIAQEAIKNASNQGDASNIKIVLIKSDQQLYLHVKDDGKGFDPANQKCSMIKSIMRRRAEEIGGRFRVKKAKTDNYRTVVTCSLPLKTLGE